MPLSYEHLLTHLRAQNAITTSTDSTSLVNYFGIIAITAGSLKFTLNSTSLLIDQYLFYGYKLSFYRYLLWLKPQTHFVKAIFTGWNSAFVVDFFKWFNSWLMWLGSKIFYQDFFHSRGLTFVSLRNLFFLRLLVCNSLFSQDPLVAQPSVAEYLNSKFWFFSIFWLRE